MPSPLKEMPVIAISTIAVAQIITITPPQTSNALCSGHASSAPINPPPLQSSDDMENDRARNAP